MYETFYGLKERPFDLAPNPRFLYLTARQREALGNLRYGLNSERGLTLLLGDAGTGKTTLLQASLAQLDRTGIECVLLNNPTLTRSEFCEAVASGFGLGADVVGSKTRFLAALRERLELNHKEGRFSALVIDEAQSLPYELLEEVRLLSNIETPTRKLLNVILAGQPELAERLNEHGLRQLKQRISLRCELGPFDMRDTAAYIAGRLRIAGGAPAQIFTREAVAAVYEGSSGLPRTINVICDNALLGGFAVQAKPVPRAIVDEVIRDFDLRPRGSSNFESRVAPSSPAPAAREALQPASPEPQAAREDAGGFTTLGLRKISFF